MEKVYKPKRTKKLLTDYHGIQNYVAQEIGLTWFLVDIPPNTVYYVSGESKIQINKVRSKVIHLWYVGEASMLKIWEKNIKDLISCITQPWYVSWYRLDQCYKDGILKVPKKII